MLTISLNIKSCSDSENLDKYISDYTNMFYILYNHEEQFNNIDFIDFHIKRSLLDKSMYESCLIDVKMKLKQHETDIKKKTEEIKSIEKYISDTEFKTNKEKQKLYHLKNKLTTLKRNLYNNVTFGGKALLREITKLSQNIDKTIEQENILIRKKNEFKEKRKLGLFLVGRACEKGNRKICFDLKNNKIIFKPNKETKIEIEFNQIHDKKKQKVLYKLQEYIENNLMPITVRITKNTIYLNYDEELLNGYSFNEIECKKEQKLIENSEEKKQIYIKYKEEQNDKKKLNKLENRYCSVDLNPNFIGFTIFDYNHKTGKQEVILTECLELTKLNNKTKLASDDPRQKKKNNKRKHEIKECWKYIFEKCKHYKVYNFVMEDLNFKSKSKDEDKGKEFNRITKNIWHRTLTVQLINKYCNTLGINKVEINPCYTSFIGNMTNTYFDPIASAMEIGRRGATKYKKGYSIYPLLTSINQEKLIYLLGENVVKEGTTWKELYKVISLLRYRNPKPSGSGLKVNYLNHCKRSKVILIKE